MRYIQLGNGVQQRETMTWIVDHTAYAFFMKAHDSMRKSSDHYFVFIGEGPGLPTTTLAVFCS